MIFTESVTCADEDIGRAVMSVPAERPREDSAFVEALKAGEAAAFDTALSLAAP